MPGVRQTTSGVVQTSSGVGVTATELMVDSFEDDNISEYNGDTGSFTVVDESTKSFTAIDGTHILQAQSGGAEIYSTTGLDNYIPIGTEFHFYTRSASGAERVSLLYGYEDGSNNFRVRVDWNNGAFELLDENGGTFSTIIEDTNISPSTGTWYRVEVVWDDGSLGNSNGDHSATLINSDTSTTVTTIGPSNNTNHSTADGIGWRFDGQGLGNSFADYLHIP